MNRAKRDIFSFKQYRHINLMRLPTKVAAGADAPERDRKRIGQLVQMGGKWPGTAVINRGWDLSPECFVGTHEIVLAFKIEKSPLLLAKAGARRRSGLCFQGEMEAFVTAILLRCAKVDAFGANPRANPPNRQPAQTGQSRRRERRPIVGANGQRQSVLPEYRLKDSADVTAISFWDSPASQQIPAVGIGDGKRIATLAIAAKKPTFEVSAPDMIRLFGMGQRLFLRRGAAARWAWVGETFAAQQFPDGAGSRPGRAGIALLQRRAKFLRSPSRVLGSQSKDARLHRFGCKPRLTMRRPAFVSQSSFPVSQIADDPFITGRTRNVEVFHRAVKLTSCA